MAAAASWIRTSILFWISSVWRSISAIIFSCLSSSSGALGALGLGNSGLPRLFFCASSAFSSSASKQRKHAQRNVRPKNPESSKLLHEPYHPLKKSLKPRTPQTLNPQPSTLNPKRASRLPKNSRIPFRAASPPSWPGRGLQGTSGLRGFRVLGFVVLGLRV